jgi:hypothetical protein
MSYERYFALKIDKKALNFKSWNETARNYTFSKMVQKSQFFNANLRIFVEKNDRESNAFFDVI